MQVPYSMDDSQPDLHEGFGGSSNAPYQEFDVDVTCVPVTPMFVFYSEKELFMSDVFQKHLMNSLASKQRQIDELRKEILDMLSSAAESV